MDTVEIQLATPSDFSEIKNLMLKALKEDPLAFSVNYEEYVNNSNEWWMNYLSHFLYKIKSNLFLLKANSQIVGMIGVMYDNKIRRIHIASIAWFYIDSNFRSKGYGRKLIEKALDTIEKDNSIKKVSLTMNSPQIAALNIYKKYGFNIVGTLNNDLYINEKYYDMYILEKMK